MDNMHKVLEMLLYMGVVEVFWLCCVFWGNNDLGN